MIGICRQQPINWFYAIKSSDTTFVAKNRHRFVRSIDTRESDPGEEIFRGFTASHYAAYFNSVEILQLVLQDEIQVCTEELVPIKAPGIGRSASFKLQPGSNVLSIALLRASAKCVRFILRFLVESDGFQAINNQDANNLSVLQIAAICNFQDAALVLRNERILKLLLAKGSRGDCSILFQAAYFGRPLVVQALIELVQRGMYVSLIQQMFEATDSSKMTVRMLAKTPINYEKLGSTLELKQQCAALVEELGVQLKLVAAVGKNLGI